MLSTFLAIKPHKKFYNKKINKDKLKEEVFKYNFIDFEEKSFKN